MGGVVTVKVALLLVTLPPSLLTTTEKRAHKTYEGTEDIHLLILGQHSNSPGSLPSLDSQRPYWKRKKRPTLDVGRWTLARSASFSRQQDRHCELFFRKKLDFIGLQPSILNCTQPRRCHRRPPSA
jgi:hypothetical protein